MRIRYPGTTPFGLPIVDCAGAESDPGAPEAAGHAYFGSGSGWGFDPCLDGCLRVVPVKESTWGGVKTQFGRNR